MRILIATGIYPPDIGGPAKYAKELAEALKRLGHEVKVLPYRLEKKLPFGVRQILYLVRIFFAAIGVDSIIALDTVSVGFPAVVVSFLMSKKIAIRTGGDFLWETYLNRTGYELPLPTFYRILPPLSFKEKVILKIHQFVLNYSDLMVFSTAWQRDIWSGFYTVSKDKVAIIENRYYEKRPALPFSKKVFLASARSTAMKNLDSVKRGFELAKEKVPEIELDLNQYSPEEYESKMKSCYAVAVVSLGDISPNSIIEALSYDKPFILTRYNGIKDRLNEAGVIVSPIDVNDIARGFEALADDNRYKEEQAKIRKITFVHTYTDIAREFTQLFSDTTDH